MSLIKIIFDWFHYPRQSYHKTNEQRRKGVSNEEIFSRLEKAVIKNKLYLKHEVNIKELASEVGTNRTYISRALKSKEFSFSRYINSFRIQYAIEVMGKDENKALSIAEIAEKCGFSSDRAMNHYLRKAVGVTASVFRKRL